MSENEPYLGVEQTAEYLCLHIETVRRMAREASLPAVKIGRSWRFKISALDEWAQSQVRPTTASPTSRPVSAHILCLDDDEDIHLFLERVFELEGFGFDAALTGEEAEALLGRAIPDLVLLDLQLPGMSGPEFLRRNQERLGGIPVIIITNYPESELLLEVMKVTPVTMLAKPLGRADLIKAVQVVLKKK